MNRRRIAPVLAGAMLAMVGGLTCTDLSGPSAGLTQVGLSPRFTRAAEDALKSLANFDLALDNIRVRLNRADGTNAVDTVVAVSPGAESVSIELTVRVTGSEEQFNAVIDLRAGDLVLFSGTQVVVAKTTGSSTSGPPVEVEYVGPGAGAVDVSVLPAEVTILSNQTAAFTAVAFDASEAELPDLLVDWSVRDPAVGAVSGAGVFTPVAGTRGSTWVIATLPTGVKDSAHVTVSPVPTTAVLISGAGQTGTVGQALSPFVFEVRAGDGLPVPGVAVTFNVSSGGGQISATSGTTDVDGRISVVLTLGAVPGGNAVQLLVGDVVFATATATAGSGLPAALVLEGGSPINMQAGQAIAAEHAVRVVDALGNSLPNIQVHLALTPRDLPEEVILQSTGTSGQDGRVLLSALGVLGQSGSFDVRATIVEPTGITPVVVPVDVAPGSGSVLAFTTQPTAAQAGAQFTVVAELRDSQGNVVTSFTGPVTIALANNPAQATLSGTLVRNAVAGVATFDDLSIARAAQGYNLAVSAVGFEGTASTAFNVDPGPVAALAFSAQSPIVGVGTPFTIVVAAQDGFGNVVTGFTDAMTVALENNPSDAVLSGTLTQSAVAGVATFGDLSLSTEGTGYTLTVTSGALSKTSAAFDAADSHRFTWIAAAGGNWSAGSNWDRGAPPGPADTAVVELDGSYVVTLDQNASVATLLFGGNAGQQRLVMPANTLTVSTLGIFSQNSALELSGGTIDGPGAIVLSGQFFWTGGTLNGSGSLQTTDGSLTEISGGTKSLTQRIVAIGGNGTWQSGDIFTGSLAQFSVLPGGSLTVAANLSFTHNLGGSPPSFVNAGTLTTSGTFVVSGLFNNAGSLVVDAGVLRLLGGGSWVPTSVSLADDAIIEFAGGSHALGGDVVLGGAGEVRVSGGIVAVVGTYSSTGITRITAGTMSFDPTTPATLAQLIVSNGTLNGGGAVNVTSQFTWGGGALNGAGSTNVMAGATATLDGAVKSLSQRTLTIAGSGAWTLGDINAGSSGQLSVLAGGTMSIPGGLTFQYNLGGAPPAVNNAGTLTVNGSVAINGAFNNSGTLDVQPGVLTLAGGGTWSGTQGVSIANSATVSLIGGTHTLGGPVNVAGTGELHFAGGTATITGTYVSAGITRVSSGTAAFSAAQAATTAQLIQSAGTIGGTGRLNVSQSFTWSGGALSELGVLNINAGATASLEGGVKSVSQHLLQIEGTASWTTGNINSGSAGQLTVAAGGSLAIPGGVAMLHNLGGAPPALNNEGTLTTNGTVSVAGTFNNSATLTVVSGVLTLSGGGTWSGAQGVTVADGALVTLTGGTHALGGAINVAGTGEMRFDGASATVSGTYANSGITRVSSGMAAFSTGTPASTVQLIVSGGALDGSGELEVTGSFAWSGGTLNGSGTTRVNANATATLNGGTKSLSVRTLLLIGNATWTTGDINSGSAGQLTVAPGATLSATDVRMFHSLGGNPPALNNSGTLTTNGIVILNGAFNNTGAVAVQTGSLTLNGGGAWSGTPVVSIPSGALGFNGGTHTLGGAITVSGGGSVFYGGANVAVTGTYASTAITRVTLGSVAFNTTQPTTLTQLFVTGGSLAGSAVVDVSQAFTWGGGTLAGSGVTNVSGNATTTIDGTVKDLSQRTLAINGAATWSSGSINSGSDARFHVLGTGSLAITGAVGIIHNLGGGPPRFVVDGTVQPFAPVTMAIPFDNQGSLVVEGGTFTMTAGGAWKGTLNVGINLNAVVDLAAGGFTHEGLLTSMGLQSGTGTMRFNGADFAVNGSYRIMGAAEVSNGKLTISQDLTVDGQLIHSGGLTTISRNLAVNGNLIHSGGQIIVGGDASFRGFQDLRDGIIELRGNFIHVGNGDNFRIAGSIPHITRFVGDATSGRLLQWDAPAGGLPSSFGQLEFAATGAEGIILATAQSDANVRAMHAIVRSNALLQVPGGGQARFVLTLGGQKGFGLVIDDLTGLITNLGTVQVVGSQGCNLGATIRGPFSCLTP